jgi:hypothetical protein
VHGHENLLKNALFTANNVILRYFVRKAKIFQKFIYSRIRSNRKRTGLLIYGLSVPYTDSWEPCVFQRLKISFKVNNFLLIFFQRVTNRSSNNGTHNVFNKMVQSHLCMNESFILSKQVWKNGKYIDIFQSFQ